MSDAHKGCHAYQNTCSGENCWFYALYEQGFITDDDMSLQDNYVILECLRLNSEALEDEAARITSAADLYEWKRRRLEELHPVLNDMIALAHLKEGEGEGFKSYLVHEKGMEAGKLKELVVLLAEFLEETERIDRIPTEAEGMPMDDHTNLLRMRLVTLLDECAERLYSK